MLQIPLVQTRICRPFPTQIPYPCDRCRMPRDYHTSIPAKKFHSKSMVHNRVSRVPSDRLECLKCSRLHRPEKARYIYTERVNKLAKLLPQCSYGNVSHTTLLRLMD